MESTPECFPYRFLPQLLDWSRGHEMSNPPDLHTVPASVESQLAALVSSPTTSKPRAHVITASGDVLLNWGDTNLPVALMGVTKLLTLSMILREFDRGAMTPETPLAELLPEQTLHGLCVLGGTDYSEAITVDHLISHRSGISDFFSPPARGIRTLRTQVHARDRAWSIDEALEIARHYPGRFTPGSPGKINYSHTNYLLLGEILQESTGMSFDQLVTLRLVGSLGLRNTYVFTPSHFDRYFSVAPVVGAGETLRFPEALASFGPVGSLISTAQEMTRVLQAFWSGELFNTSWREDLMVLPLPLGRGVRMSRGLMTVGTRGRPEPMVGHSGSSGAAALIDTSTGAVGFMTTNSVAPPTTTFRSVAGIVGRVVKAA